MVEVYIDGTKYTGKGIFTNTNIKKGEFIIEFEDELYTVEQIISQDKNFMDNSLQIDKNLYIGPGDKLNFINHSCSPNCWVKIENNRAYLIALKDINKGEELVYDYSTTMDEDDWEMNCNCNSYNCRKRIRDFKHLPEETQQKYIELGIVPNYIIQYVYVNNVNNKFI